jgi:hypothetical protein
MLSYIDKQAPEKRTNEDSYPGIAGQTEERD